MFQRLQSSVVELAVLQIAENLSHPLSFHRSRKANNNISMYLTQSAYTHKLHKTNIPHTILKFIVNCIKARKAYTTFRNKTKYQQNANSKRVFHKAAFYLRLTTYADNITITSTYNEINIAKADSIIPIKIHTWTHKQSHSQFS